MKNIEAMLMNQIGRKVDNFGLAPFPARGPHSNSIRKTG